MDYQPILHSALQREETICLPPASCHVFSLYKIKASYFFFFESLLLIFCAPGFKSNNSCTDFSSGHMDKVKYTFHKRFTLHRALSGSVLNDIPVAEYSFQRHFGYIIENGHGQQRKPTMMANNCIHAFQLTPDTPT